MHQSPHSSKTAPGSSSPGSHNETLLALIHRRINAEGPIPFSDFMRQALYHHELGYYLACDPTLDYQSSPNVHPIFGACLARQIAGFWREMGRPEHFTIFEAAAGNGRLCADILTSLQEEQPVLFELVRYVQQDLSLEGEVGRKRLLDAGVPETKIEIAEQLPTSSEIEGCIISNELLDALPFDRVVKRDGRLFELRVGLDDGRLVDIEAPLRPELEAHFAQLGLQPGEGCEAEVCLEATRWMKSAGNALKRGYILTLDYGYEAADLYAPWRKRGTLLTFYQQTSGEDPYERIGRQDITASVDFTSFIRAGEAAGLQTIGNLTQAEYLAALGIGDALTQAPTATDLERFYSLRRAAIELTDMSGLGRIRALLQSKNV
jgi:SAM-dependent MidA family methyltransferase